MTRTQRFVGGVILGHTHLVLATIVGLWMTPFLLRRLGQESVGLWLVAQQLIGYLLLMDIGVNALLPRETAFAVGRARSEGASDLPQVVARARAAVQWQAPVVGLAALAVWLWMPAYWSPAAGPLAFLLVSFVAVFPLRLYSAFLQGLQDLPFLGRVQVMSWALGTGLTIGLVLQGASLYALMAGWAAAQLFTAAAARLRIARRYRSEWPAATLRVPVGEVGSYVRQAGWISLAQVSQVLLTGSDLLLIGALLGAGAVVRYSCTSKLAAVLSNHPQLIMQAATPALSEFRAANERDRLLKANVALMLAMLSVSGLVACVVLAVNGSFVRWWVGEAQYGGQALTILFAFHLVVRHVNVTWIYGLFSLGQERRISITNLADGAASIGLGLVLVPLVGPAGAVLGSLLAVSAISVPANISALARLTETTPLTWIEELMPWFRRFGAFALASSLLPLVWSPAGPGQIMGAATVIAALYAVVMWRGLSDGPLGAYVRPRVAALLPPGWRLRLSSSST